MDLTDRVAVVTGSGRGIGKAIVSRLAENGAKVVVAEVAAYGEEVAKGLCASGAEAMYCPVDVSDPESVKAMVERVDERWGRLDVLVNNAGIRPTCPFLEMSLSDWDRVVAVNLTGTFNCCAAIAPLMVQRSWGRIVNISSLAAQRGSTGGHSHYAAAKAGIVGFSKSLARELAPHGITVNTVAPGFIETLGWEGQLDGQIEKYAAQVPLGRLGQPDDIANLVAFLVSDGASYLTGVTVPINGGLFIY